MGLRVEATQGGFMDLGLRLGCKVEGLGFKVLWVSSAGCRDTIPTTGDPQREVREGTLEGRVSWVYEKVKFLTLITASFQAYSK